LFFLYSLLTALGVLFALPYWAVGALRHGKYFSNLKERLGVSYSGLAGPQKGQGTTAIWLHAVSVGEVLSGVALARGLKEQHPQRRLIVSTTTQTGQAIARERMSFADAIIYFPLDWGFVVKRALRAVRPGIVVVLETELWPNFLRETQRQGIPVVYLSGRISERSFGRYKRALGVFGFLVRPFLKRVLSIPRAFRMQSEQDAARLSALGAPQDRIVVGGNLKYDLEVPPSTPLAEWLEREAVAGSRRPLVVAGSVVANEEPLALIAFGTAQGEHAHALLVLAPRKPERFDAAAEFIEESHRKFVRRSALGIPGPNGTGPSGLAVTARIAEDVTVLLLDSIGELASLYRVADVVFVGGSLVPSGGHNILEPAAFGKIPVFGPHTENFAEMTARFVEAGAAIRAGSPEDVGVAWIELLRDPERMREMGAKARALVEGSRGATARALDDVRRLLAGGS